MKKEVFIYVFVGTRGFTPYPASVLFAYVKSTVVTPDITWDARTENPATCFSDGPYTLMQRKLASTYTDALKLESSKSNLMT